MHLFYVDDVSLMYTHLHQHTFFLTLTHTFFHVITYSFIHSLLFSFSRSQCSLIVGGVDDCGVSLYRVGQTGLVMKTNVAAAGMDEEKI